MAASDKPFRSQNILDIVFGASSLLMLLSIVWMLVQDYNREFKTEQRRFRDVEVALAQRIALEQIPSEDEFNKAEAAYTTALAERDKKVAELNELKTKLAVLQPKIESLNSRYNEIKSYISQAQSEYDLGMERLNDVNNPEIQGFLSKLNRFKEQLASTEAERDQVDGSIKSLRKQKDAIESPLTKAEADWKKVTDRFDSQVNIAINKQWGFGDWFRSLPIIDGFASPTKIQQITLYDVPIDYNFKNVTRYDRCTSCHVGIDRPAYTPDNLKKLLVVTDDDQSKLDSAHKLMAKRREALEPSLAAKTPTASQLKLSKVPESTLTASRIKEFAAHPRLDLFVGSNSKHPSEKFGCSSCHAGQGSGTTFVNAAHTPNNATAKAKWEKSHDWEASHMWDFPMLPSRFVESSCVKCHHEITDLIGTDNRNEAPKLLRGYNLIKENGCFGCHEIQGTKSGQQIGPDMRLENNPPLDNLNPIERNKIESDPDNKPGNMRKVGPSLYRLVEKTNPDWTAKWIRSPRGYRPDTKMPHYYGVSNNDVEALKGTGQEEFPDTEIWAITNYLFGRSTDYVKKIAEHAKDPAEARKKDQEAFETLLSKGKLTIEERRELDRIKELTKLRNETVLVDLAPGHPGDAANGRLLFTERGCLACHAHQATETDQGKVGEKTFAAKVIGEANFGPNLSQLVEKFSKSDKAESRKWLIQWLLNPQVHSPRSRMPMTHLEPNQAADVAAWLLSQPATDLGAEWASLSVKQPQRKQLEDLARVYLTRILAKSDMDSFLKDGKLEAGIVDSLPVDEKELAQNFNEDNLKKYLGKKAIGRLGCYGCHDIPGFESSRPIGVGLNDWGKKEPEKLAFEDIANYFSKHYVAKDSLVDDEGKPYPFEKDGDTVKKPYEQFYARMLTDHHSHNRMGYLNQKLLDPRSYDYARLRAWDDRSRMPEFRFARSRKKAGETQEQYEARSWKDEAEAREAVMTFVLGLVAEKVPSQSINQPKGDRLAEVKGRQILDKYNCSSCHLVRPGTMEFVVNPETVKKLNESFDLAKGSSDAAGAYTFYNHSFFVGKTPTTPDRLTAVGIRPRIMENDGKKLLTINLVQALRYFDENKAIKDIPGGNSLLILGPGDLGVDPSNVDTQEKLDRYLAPRAAQGGYLSDLLWPYLVKKDPKVWKIEGEGTPFEDSAAARASLPPLLTSQGERTQPEWLYQFLLNPHPVRRMSILRMPQFNMSPDEARTLVDYFAAVTKSTNPGIGLVYPHDNIPQRGELDSDYWKQKTREYVERLRAQKGKAKDGKESTLLEQRLAEYEPVWRQLEKDNPGKKEWSVDAQKKAWLEQDAYATDSYRLLANRKLCLQCHQVGSYEAGNKEAQGPPLILAQHRLRPGWTERWIATPQRFLTYNSLMPVNFPVNKKAEHQHLLAGVPIEQVQAVRDALLNYSRIVALPVNRLWNPDLLEEKKADNKK